MTASQPGPSGITVSVAMITYIHERFIAQAIESVMEHARSGFVVSPQISKDGLLDAAARVRSASVELASLVAPGPSDLIAPLIADTDPGVRAAVVSALAELRDKNKIDIIRPLLQDPDPFTQQEAAISLAKLDDNSGEHLLLKALSQKRTLKLGRKYTKVPLSS